MPDLDDVLCGALLVFSCLGIAYFLAPDFKGWADKEAIPAVQQWGDRHLPAWETVKTGWEQGRESAQ